MRPWSLALLLILAVAGGMYMPVPQRLPLASVSPVGAALGAEGVIPLLGLGWGRVRGWQRLGDGWRVLWQPSHGAWVLHAWVPDRGGSVRWRLEVAPWLPGARLSQPAARLLVGGSSEDALPLDRVGRRDWQIGEWSLTGAVVAGRPLLREGESGGWLWQALMVGLLFSGAMVRVVLPVSPMLAWRARVWWVAGVVLVVLPWLTPLAVRTFRVGVRPWVAELTFGTVAVMLLAAVSVAAARYPVAAGRPSAEALAVGLGVGLLAGRLEPIAWLVDVAGLSLRGVAWVGIVVLGAWLVSLAGEGLRHLLAAARGGGRWLLSGIAVASAISAGAWLGTAVAVICAAAQRRGQGTLMAAAVLLGWIVGGTTTVCAWQDPLRDALVLLIAGCLVIVWVWVSDWRRGLVLAGERVEA